MAITLHVPVPRYVAKYIRVKFELKEGEPWKVLTRGIENKMLSSLLEATPNRTEIYRKNQVMLDIYLSDWIYLTKGGFLSQESIDDFCDFIKQRIQEEITMHCQGLRYGIGLKKVDKVVTNISPQPGHIRVRRIPTQEGVRFFSQKETINDIFEKYQITDADLRFDSVLKHVQRQCLQHN